MFIIIKKKYIFEGFPKFFIDMGGKESKQFPITYEEAVKRG